MTPVQSLRALAVVPALMLVVAPPATRTGGPAELGPHRVAPWFAPATLDTAVFAGGCFWGIEAVFEHLKGVKSAVSGYAGGRTPSPSYDEVGSGTTGHAESVQVIYDPATIAYADLLQVFFTVAHDPAQHQAAEKFVAELVRTKAYPRPVVTQIAPLAMFYPAEAHHQNYMEHHPDQPYIISNDPPQGRTPPAGLSRLVSGTLGGSAIGAAMGSAPRRTRKERRDQ